MCGELTRLETSNNMDGRGGRTESRPRSLRCSFDRCFDNKLCFNRSSAGSTDHLLFQREETRSTPVVVAAAAAGLRTCANYVVATGNFCRQCFTLPQYYSRKCEAVAMIFKQLLSHPFIPPPLIITPPASVRRCYHASWFITHPCMAPATSKFHPHYKRKHTRQSF